MKKKKKFWDRPLRFKISFLTVIVAFVPFFLFFGTVSIMYNRAYEQRSEQQIKENLTVMAGQIEKVFSDTVLCSNYVTLNLNTIYDDKTKHQVDRDNMIKSVLNQNLLIFDGLDSLVYLDSSGNMYSTYYNLYEKKAEISNSVYMEQLKQIKNGQTILFDIQSDCMSRSDERPVVTMGKRIIHITSGETLGFLFVNLNVKQLEESMENEITNYYLLDASDNSVAYIQENISMELEALLDSSNSKNSQDQEMKIIKLDHTKYLLGETNISPYEWKVIGVTDLGVYNVSMNQIIRIAGIVLAVTIFLLIILSVVITKMLTKPLTQLKQGAEEIAKGNLNVEFHFEYDDEIGLFGRVFNHMTKEIARLFEQVESEAKKRSEYELALVQEQVKPHFLYNTLDIIIMLIEMNKSREASRVTKKLADYYKNSLSSSMGVIPMERELRILEDYLDLQLMRYKDKFKYEIRMDDGLAQVYVPKMTLQPLVENAIYHGLKYKEEWGTIEVTVTAKDSYAVMMVKDDGVGMDEETLQKLSQYDEKQDGHFGVYSVLHRLKLYYGEQCKIQIDSKKGEGTVFYISVPIDWKEKEHA